MCSNITIFVLTFALNLHYADILAPPHNFKELFEVLFYGGI